MKKFSFRATMFSGGMIALIASLPTPEISSLIINFWPQQMEYTVHLYILIIGFLLTVIGLFLIVKLVGLPMFELRFRLIFFGSALFLGLGIGLTINNLFSLLEKYI
jgi:hypothetical protein